MVILDTKKVKMVWAAKPRPDAQGELDPRRRMYPAGMVIPRPLVRRRSLENKTRPTAIVIRRETPGPKDTSSLDRSSATRHTMTAITPVKTEAVKSERKTVVAPPATKITTELKPILKSSKSSHDAKVEDTKLRETLTAGLDNKFSYRLPDKPTVTKTKKSVHFKDSDISKISRKQYSSPVYSVQYTSSGFMKPELIDRRQIYV